MTGPPAGEPAEEWPQRHCRNIRREFHDLDPSRLQGTSARRFAADQGGDQNRGSSALDKLR